MQKFVYGWSPAGIAPISGLGLGLMGGEDGGNLASWLAPIGAWSGPGQMRWERPRAIGQQAPPPIGVGEGDQRWNWLQGRGCKPQNGEGWSWVGLARGRGRRRLASCAHPLIHQFTGCSGCHNNWSFWSLWHSNCWLFIFIDRIRIKFLIFLVTTNISSYRLIKASFFTFFSSSFILTYILILVINTLWTFYILSSWLIDIFRLVSFSKGQVSYPAIKMPFEF